MQRNLVRGKRAAPKEPDEANLPRPPSAGIARLVPCDPSDPDMAGIAVHSNGESVDLLFYAEGKGAVGRAIPSRQFARMAWWYLWRVWAVGLWFGVRLWLWERAVRRKALGQDEGGTTDGK